LKTKLKNKPKVVKNEKKLSIFLVSLIIVAAIVTSVHWPGLSSKALMFDDDQYLTDNQLVQNPSYASAKRFFTEVLRPSTVRGYYQPLAMVSIMADVAAGGSVQNLKPFRITSLIIHVINTILVAVILYFLFGQPIPAAMLALLWGVHPITIASVVWLSERKTLLASFFALLSLISYLGYTRKKSWFAYGLSILLFVLSLLSKPSIIAIPVLFLLLDYWPLNRLNRRAFIEKIPLFVILAVFAAVTFISQSRAASVKTPMQTGFLHTLLVPCHNIIFYIRNLIWPTNLSWFYPYPYPFNLSNPMVLTGLIGTALLIAFLLISMQWTKSLLTGFFFFLAAILPTLGIISVHPAIAGDRHLYFPVLGILLPIGYFLSKIWTKPITASAKSGYRIIIAIILIVLTVPQFFLTRRYLNYWRDSETLYAYMLSKSPNTALIHNNLANFLKNAGKTREAVYHLRMSLDLKPDSPVIYNNLANALCKIGQIDQAVEHYKKALKLMPGFAVAHFNLAAAYEQQGKTTEAIAEYRQALKFKPDYIEALGNMGFALAKQKKFEEAVGCYKRVLELNPGSVIAHGRLGLALAGQGKVDEAIEQFRIVLKYRPDDYQMIFNIGVLLHNQNKIDEAIAEYRRVLEIKPDYEKAKDKLTIAEFYKRTGYILKKEPQPEQEQEIKPGLPGRATIK